MSRAADARTALAIGIAALFLMAVASCSSGMPHASAPVESPPTASRSVGPSASPASASAALAPSANVPVSFSGLPGGTYPVHIHSRCSGNQAFHIITIESLRVSSGGGGSIEVPRGYFGRGLCVIVYANPSLSAVLTTRPI
jgi:hypothetical protein